MKSTIERYVRDVEKRLPFIPHERRQAELEEIYQHLAASAQAYEELGLEPDAAAQEAIRQFGTARASANALQYAWWRPMLSGLDTTFKAVVLTVLLSYTFGFLTRPLADLLTETAYHFGAGTVRANALHLVWVGLILVLPKMVVGVVIARYKPRHAITGLAIARLLMFTHFVLRSLPSTSGTTTLCSWPGTLQGVIVAHSCLLIISVLTASATVWVNQKRLALS